MLSEACWEISELVGQQRSGVSSHHPSSELVESLKAWEPVRVVRARLNFSQEVTLCAFNHWYESWWRRPTAAWLDVWVLQSENVPAPGWIIPHKHGADVSSLRHRHVRSLQSIFHLLDFPLQFLFPVDLHKLFPRPQSLGTCSSTGGGSDIWVLHGRI